MNKQQLSQLVQDVINGDESSLKAMKILLDLKKHINKCFIEVNRVYLSELDDDECDATESDIY